MRKWGTMLLSITIAICLFGCSSSEKEKEVEKGRYMEKTIDLPEIETLKDYWGIAYDSQGRLCIAASTGRGADTKLVTYIQKENDYEKTIINGLEKYFNDGYILDEVVLGENDKWYVRLSRTFYVDKKGKEHTEDSIIGKNRTYSVEERNKIMEYTKDMKQYNEPKLLCDGKDITPATWVTQESGVNSEDTIITKMSVSKEGIIVYHTLPKGNLIKYNSTTKKEEEITSKFVNDLQPWYLKRSTLYVGTTDGSGKGKSIIDMYDLRTNANKSVKADVSVADADQCKIYVDSEETIYMVNKKGIYKHQKNGTLWEELLKADKFSLAGFNVMLSNALVDKGGKINVLTYMKNSQKLNLYQYYFDKNAIVNPSKKLTIYSLWESGTIREAVRKYQLKNPDIEIEFTMADQNSNDKAEIIKKLNTEILAGKGADILITDGLNRISYEKKGVLEELSDVVDSSRLLDAVAKNYSKDKKVYGVPVKISLPIVVSENEMKEALSSMKKLTEYCRNQKRPVFLENSPDLVLEMLLYSYGNELLAEDGTLYKDKLSSYLEQAKTIINQSNTKNELSIPASDKAKVCWADTTFSEDPLAYTVIPSFSVDASSVFTISKAPADVSTCEVLKKELKANYASINNSFISSGTVSVNANGKMKKEAKEFIKYLFGDEIQGLDCGDGYPVTKTALEEWRSSYTAGQLIGGYFDKNKKLIPLFIDPPDDTIRKIAINMVEEAKQPIYQDVTIVNLIMEESTKYINGGADLNTTVNTIIQKVDRYLEEQK